MIRVGTSGWSYPTGEGRWEGVFYPRGKKVDHLEFYSRYFNTVEINSSFYRPILPNVALSWAKKTPSDFSFTAKLYQKFTHPKMFEKATGKEAELSAEDFDRFRVGLEPLVEAGKLGCLLAQFPPSFKHDEESVTYLEDLIRRFKDYSLAVELRHRSWTDSPDTVRLLDAYEVAWCMIDEPKFKTSVDEVPLTSKTGYFRFHGRNAKEWWRGDRESRYNYLYSPQEVASLAQDVREVAERAESVYVFYNNHFSAKAVVNALQMKLQFGQRLPDQLPEGLEERYPQLKSDGFPGSYLDTLWRKDSHANHQRRAEHQPFPERSHRDESDDWGAGPRDGGGEDQRRDRPHEDRRGGNRYRYGAPWDRRPYGGRGEGGHGGGCRRASSDRAKVGREEGGRGPEGQEDAGRGRP